MLKKLICFIITFSIIIIILNFLKKQTHENFSPAFTIPDNVITNYTGNYYTNNSKFNEKVKRYSNLLHLELSKKLIIVGHSIKNKDLKNKKIPITNFIDPSTIIANYRDYSIIINLLENNNITLSYKKDNSDKWTSINPKDIDYLKKIIIDSDYNKDKVLLTSQVNEHVSLSELNKINKIKTIFKIFKYNKTNTLRSISTNPIHTLIRNPQHVTLNYSYVYSLNTELMNSFNLQSKPHNIDITHKNMKNSKYGLIVQIPFHEDFKHNKLNYAIKNISHINIGIYYRGRKQIDELIFINNKTPTAIISWGDLLNKYIARINNNKTFCSFRANRRNAKCGKIKFPYVYSRSENEETCLNNILPSIYNNCTNSAVRIRPCIINFRNEQLHRTCFNPNYLFHNVDYYTNQFTFTTEKSHGKSNAKKISGKKMKSPLKSKKEKKLKNVLSVSENKEKIYFRFLSADKKFGTIKYGDPVYIYCVNKKRFNDNPNGHGPGTPLSFNQKRPKSIQYS